MWSSGVDSRGCLPLLRLLRDDAKRKNAAPHAINKLDFVIVKLEGMPDVEPDNFFWFFDFMDEPVDIKIVVLEQNANRTDRRSQTSRSDALKLGHYLNCTISTELAAISALTALPENRQFARYRRKVVHGSIGNITAKGLTKDFFRPRAALKLGAGKF